MSRMRKKSLPIRGGGEAGEGEAAEDGGSEAGEAGEGEAAEDGGSEDDESWKEKALAMQGKVKS